MSNENTNSQSRITVTGYLKENDSESETIRFNIRLGFFKLSCLVHIPPDGETVAPVYVKFGLHEP